MTRREDHDANRPSTESLTSGDPVGWFERLYAEAARGTALIPWDRGAPNTMLVQWAVGLSGAGPRRWSSAVVWAATPSSSPHSASRPTPSTCRQPRSPPRWPATPTARSATRSSAAAASLVATGGTLLVLAAAGDRRAQGPPWPLTREEIEAFAVDDLTLVSTDVPRWRAVFQRRPSPKNDHTCTRHRRTTVSRPDSDQIRSTTAAPTTAS